MAPWDPPARLAAESEVTRLTALYNATLKEAQRAAEYGDRALAAESRAEQAERERDEARAQALLEAAAIAMRHHAGSEQGPIAAEIHALRWTAEPAQVPEQVTDRLYGFLTTRERELIGERRAAVIKQDFDRMITLRLEACAERDAAVARATLLTDALLYVRTKQRSTAFDYEEWIEMADRALKGERRPSALENEMAVNSTLRVALDGLRETVASLRAEFDAVNERRRQAETKLAAYVRVKAEREELWVACFEDLPTCSGAWIAGSGGHRAHDPPCDNIATWWHPGDMWAYCDQHINEREKGADRPGGYIEATWAPLVRDIRVLQDGRKTLAAGFAEACRERDAALQRAGEAGRLAEALETAANFVDGKPQDCDDTDCKHNGGAEWCAHCGPIVAALAAYRQAGGQ
jgi:hypothetical protein